MSLIRLGNYPAVSDLNRETKSTVSSFSLEVIDVAGLRMDLKPVSYLDDYVV